MKCFVVFAALAVIGFVSGTPAQDGARIKSDAAALGNFYNTQEKASVENTFASYVKELTRYKSNLVTFMNLMETKMDFLETPGKQYWLGLLDKINPLIDLTNLWGNTQIRAKTNAYLAQYKQQAVNPTVSSLNDIATKVSKNTTANLVSCYDNNKYMYASNLDMTADNVRMNSGDMYNYQLTQVLDMLNTNLDQVNDAPNMAIYDCSVQGAMYIQYNETCVLQKYIDNEPALLAAYSAYRDGAIAGWAASLDQSLQYRQMNWQMGPMMMSSYIDMINQCMRDWTPPMPPMPPM